MLYLVVQMGVILAVAAAVFFALGCWYASARVAREQVGALDAVEVEVADPRIEAAEVEIDGYREQVAGLQADLAKARAHMAFDEPVAFAGLPPGAEEDAELGAVYPMRPESADDLTAIRGIGKVVARQLNELGIYTLAQIAGWDRPQMDAISVRMGFKDRIRRDDWGGQARRLV